MRCWRALVTGMMAVGLTCASLLLSCSSGETRTQERLSPPPPASAAEERVPATAPTPKQYVIAGKTYYPPVALRYSDMHMDSGTRFVQMLYARGKMLLACNDGRAYLRRKGEPIDRPVDRPIYIGGEHPMHEGSKPLPLGGADEREVYRMLKEWADGGQKLGGPPFQRESETDYRAENAKKFQVFLEQYIERHRPK